MPYLSDIPAGEDFFTADSSGLWRKTNQKIGHQNVCLRIGEVSLKGIPVYQKSPDYYELMFDSQEVYVTIEDWKARLISADRFQSMLLDYFNWSGRTFQRSPVAWFVSVEEWIQSQYLKYK